MSNTPIGICGYPNADTVKSRTYTACKGMNCGATDGVSHSAECQAEHAAAVAGGSFVKIVADTGETMSMTVEEALQRADALKEQGCITPTAQALLALAEALRSRTEGESEKA